MSRIQIIVASVLWGIVFGSQGSSLQEEMLRELDRIHNVFHALYAPKAWKKEFAHWELDQEIQKAKEKVTANPSITVKEYHRILQNFFNSTLDFHVGMVLHSTESAALPFQIKGVGDRYFLVYIDRTKLSKGIFPFQEGDEVVNWGDQPVHQAVTEIQKELAAKSDQNPTYHELAEIFLTKRLGRLSMKVPKGAITIGIRPKGKQQVYSRQLKWDYRPERIQYKGMETSYLPNLVAPVTMPLEEDKSLPPIFGMSMKAANWVTDPDIIPLLPNQEDNNYLLGGKKSFVPDLGTKLWDASSSSSFHAYLFRLPTNSKVIGYIRIPHYQGRSWGATDFEEIIKRFEDKADALVIDQVNNPGGSVFYMYALLSMLTEQPLVTPQHRMSITPSNVKEAYQKLEALEDIQDSEKAKKVLGATADGYPVTYETVNFLRDYYRFIIDQWNAGKRLSEPYYLMGVDYINPYPEVQFTKPILLLVNGLVFSGGDFFSAILQDNKRATLLGTRTAGAGGYVLQEKTSNPFGLESFSVTGSIAIRANQQPIENLGVKPEIEYAFTVDDLTQNYKGYVKAIHKALETLTK